MGTNPVAQNVGGYIISPDKQTVQFLLIMKKEDISLTTQYEDKFISRKFTWMFKNRRTLNSPDVQAIVNYKNGLEFLYLLKKVTMKEKIFTIWGINTN